MDVLSPSLEQNPIFGNASPGGSSVFLKWEYGFFKFFNWLGDILPVIFSQETWSIIKAVLSIISIFCITVMVYCTIRMFELRKKEHHHLQEEIEEYAHNQAKREKERQENMQISSNPQWVNVINYISSPDPSQWRLAIMEADNMLDALLTKLGFQGESLGEKLKSVDQNKFRSLASAWEVHTVRNKIAHEGSDFELSPREARRIVSLYEQIFREYAFI